MKTVLTASLILLGGLSAPGAAFAQAAAPAPVAGTAVPDAKKGETSFGQCKACHSFDATKKSLGPHLAGVVGRKIGSVKGYDYSPDYLKAKGKWDEAALIKYLADPKAMFPDTRMTWKVKNPETAANIVAYLKTNPK
jgi:cytochrome c